MKEQYTQLIKAFIQQYSNIGDEACITEIAGQVLDSSFQWIREFSKNPHEETIVNMIIELSAAKTPAAKMTSLLVLAFVLGTTKMPTDVATGLFDELLFRLYDAETSDEELTNYKSVIANLYTTANENSPF
ncbi:hypothetical protein [Dendrosporobacter sp. 1207_IL3150]|uniref:hypothetical protein n=1 Tax=Dendrosporobacter sp. 1207_IL3150 TaxID=3084054 RepID=UPI002FD89093